MASQPCEVKSLSRELLIIAAIYSILFLLDAVQHSSMYMVLDGALAAVSLETARQVGHYGL